MTWRSEENTVSPKAAPAGHPSGLDAAAPPARLSVRLESLRLPREAAAMAEALRSAIGEALAGRYAAYPGFAAANREGSPESRRLSGLIRQSSLRLTESLQSRMATEEGRA